MPLCPTFPHSLTALPLSLHNIPTCSDGRLALSRPASPSPARTALSPAAVPTVTPALPLQAPPSSGQQEEWGQPRAPGTVSWGLSRGPHPAYRGAVSRAWCRSDRRRNLSSENHNSELAYLFAFGKFQPGSAEPQRREGICLAGAGWGPRLSVGPGLGGGVGQSMRACLGLLGAHSQEPSSLNPRPGLEATEEHRATAAHPLSWGGQLDEGVALGGVGSSHGNTS